MRSAVLGMVCTVGLAGWIFRPNTDQSISNVFVSGERLEYKVKWLFLRLGTIVVTSDPLPGVAGKFRTTITLDSNPDLFFITLHNRYEAIVNINPVRCESFWSIEVDDEDTIMTTYIFSWPTRQVMMRQSVLPADSVLKEEMLDSVDRFFDGASLFFYARSLSHEDTSLSVPTLVEFDLFSTDLTVTKRIVPVSIDALDDHIRTRELFGKARFEGSTFGGFSGDFRGWFSDDPAAVPIRAEMSITLGTVNVELERWTRTGWQPPTTTVQ